MTAPKNIAKAGDTIEWSFEADHGYERVAGKTFFAKVAAVFLDTEEYGVYAEYGQDKIPFNDAKIINMTPTEIQHLKEKFFEYIKNLQTDEDYIWQWIVDNCLQKEEECKHEKL